MFSTERERKEMTIFLSHASKDKDIVERLYKRLDAASSVLDTMSFEPGDDNLDSMNTKLDTMTVFVFVVSPDMPDGSFAFFEAQQAAIKKSANRNIEIIG